MAFLLKKMIAFWLMPLSFSIALITIGLLLLWFTKRQTCGKILSSTGLFLLFIFSWNPISTELLRPIEQSSPAFNEQKKVDYIVVLGNQVDSDSSITLTNQLSSSARARILEGVRLAKLQPNSQLIVSGYAGNNSKSCAEIYAQVAVQLGIEANRIIELREPKDTSEEAVAVKAIAGDHAIALVTSASHMSRAFYYFENENIQTITAPTFYLAKKTHAINWKFNAEGLLKSERAIHEYIGQAWQRFTSH